MRRPLRRLAVPLVLCASLTGLAGCGQEDERKFAETEGLYLDIGELNYQVQLSRQLNPTEPEDEAYLRGLPEDTPPLGRDEVWFAVFIRVQNQTDEPIKPTTNFRIVDTLENVYRPVRVDAEENPFLYVGDEAIPPDGIIPERDTASSDGPIQGSLVLFRLERQSFENRPLEFEIRAFKDGEEAEFDTGVVDLDV